MFFNKIYRIVSYRIVLFKIQYIIFLICLDNALAGHVVSNLSISSSLDCMLECVGDVRCLSYNFAKGASSLGVCELNNHTRLTKPNDLFNRLGYTYIGSKVCKG